MKKTHMTNKQIDVSASEPPKADLTIAHSAHGDAHHAPNTYIRDETGNKEKTITKLQFTISHVNLRAGLATATA